ncbi:uncharacterized protein LOC120120551 [Hibiscus syriacus]|uniref:uncharacterized protein LOC120120551 n=1 Tax=Hibiscus syriacus TaxID=106335 RepID=UPI0019219A35|nr:uncharacterized protein LOC120120551 [Hibiscus syriacus]
MVELLKVIKARQIPGCIWGDFNMFLDVEEKVGFSTNQGIIELFINFVFEAGLLDLPLVGGRFTWCNNRVPPTFVRLDRFLLTAEFEVAFPDMSQKLLHKSLSDHNAIHLSVFAVDWGPKPFRLLNHWLEDDGFAELVLTSITNSKQLKPRIRIGGIIRESKMTIKKWVKRQNESGKKSCAMLEKEISALEEEIQSGSVEAGVFHKWKELRSQLWAEYRKEELTWLQKSRLRWFAEGDRNTWFFQLTASARRRANSISVLKRGRRSLWIQKIRDMDAFFLESPFSEQKVWEALFSSDSNRASGPDGLNLGFSKKLWAQLKAEIMRFFMDFSKIVIGNRGSTTLSSHLFQRWQIIGDSQFAFIAGRQILDCSLIANETIDFVSKSRHSGVAFKIDFHKAYDTISWEFLLQILKKCGFREKWCMWIYKCISSAKISILVNGAPMEAFSISRGLRQ